MPQERSSKSKKQKQKKEDHLEFQKNLKVESFTDSQLKSFCGVPRKIVDFLLFKVGEQLSVSRLLTKESKIILTLGRLKLAVSFSVLGAFFNVSEMTASRAFQEGIEALHNVALKYVCWLDKKIIQSRMPKAFKAYFPNVRAIIDCSEIECERPSEVRQRVLTYSSYKGRHTVKFLIAVAPSGEIMFVSSAYGGRTTDTDITVNSGFLELLEEGDLILADKGFPSIETDVNRAGGILVMPPFRRGERQLSEKENQDGYKIAAVRVLVERAIERLKRFEILHHVKIRQMDQIDKVLMIPDESRRLILR